MLEFIGVLLFLAFFFSSDFLLMKVVARVREASGLPLARGALALPILARTRDADGVLLAELADLLEQRPGLEKAFAQDSPTNGGNSIEAVDRWRRNIFRKKDIHAVALTTALCRLCPLGLPDDEADFWQKGLLDLLDEGEGHFLLGLSHLRLYLSLHTHDERPALEGWRQAVGHFRHSAAAGHEDGMKAAYLLARIGHDVPFTPPAALPEPLPVYGWGADRDPETMYWRYRLAEAGNPAATALGMQYLLQAPPDRRKAEHWLRRAMESGDHQAAGVLFDNYRNGNFPDDTGKNAAVCMIFFICQSGFQEFKRPITDEELTWAEGELDLDADVRRLMALHNAEGRAFHTRIMDAVHDKNAAAEARRKRHLVQAEKKLPALRRAAEARRMKRLSTKSGKAAPTPRETTPRGGPVPPPSAPACKDRPRRSLARPDKR